MAERPGDGDEPKGAGDEGLPTSPRSGVEATLIATRVPSGDNPPISARSGAEATMIATKGSSTGDVGDGLPTSRLTGAEATIIATGGPSTSASEEGVVRISREAMDTLIAGAPQARRVASRIRVGDTVGRYRIEGQLGAGGMGTVYLAHDPDLDRRVAIKVLHSRVSTDAQSLGSQRLLREAQAMARLAHPNVVTVHDVGVVGESLFVAMELIDGDDLRGWLSKGPRGWREIVAAFIEAGQGLAAAHKAEIVHRDFKPDNVMVAATGRICVGDFGLAAAAAAQAPELSAEPKGDITTSWLSSAGTLTVPGAVMGTPAYMAPEQMIGGEITPAADIFSFCVALYEALYDQRPFAGESVAEIYLAITQGELAPFPKGKVPRRLERLLRRGLASEPEDRPPSIEAVLAELRPLISPKTLRWLSLGAVGVAAVAVGVALGSGGAEEPASCEGGGEEVAKIWSRERADGLKEAFEATAVIHATATWGRVEASLDRTFSQWRDAHRQACEETHHSGQFSEAILALRVACLNRQLGEIDAFLDFLADGDKKVVDNAVRLVGGLPDPKACDPAQVLADASRERSPELEALEKELAKGRRLHLAGKYAEAQALLEPLRESARALGDPELEAEVLMKLSHTVYIDRQEESGELLREALEASLRTGRDRDFARIAADQLGLVASDAERRELWMGLGEAALARAAARQEEIDTVLAKLKTNYGNALSRSGSPREALKVHREALRLHLKADETSFLVGDSTYNVGSTLAALERYGRASELIDEAIAIWARELGPEHPRMVHAHRSLAIIRKMEGNNDAALRAAQEAFALTERLWGEESPRLVDKLMLVGVVQSWQGELAASSETFGRALAIVDAHPPGPGYVPLYMVIADDQIAWGDLQQGEELLEMARAQAEKEAPEPTFLREYYGLTTEAALRRKDYVRAKREFDAGWAEQASQGSIHSGLFGYTAVRAAEIALHRGELAEGLSALALCESQYPQPLKQGLMRGKLLWARARLLRRSGREKRALEIGAEALAVLDRLGPGYEPMRVEIRAWLEEQGPA